MTDPGEDLNYIDPGEFPDYDDQDSTLVLEEGAPDGD